MTDVSPSPTTVLGVGASPGIAVGPVISITTEAVELPSIAEPLEAISSSAAAVSAHLSALSDTTRSSGREDAADVLNAQSLIAEDPMIPDAIGEHLDAGLDLDSAFDAAASQLRDLLASLPDPYLAARAADVGEVMDAIKRDMAGLEPETTTLDEPSILVAHELTAAETAGLDPGLVLGFATETGGATSHVAIIARSLGVPAVVGATGLLALAPSMVALDGRTGEVIADPSQDQLDEYSTRLSDQANLRARLDESRGSVARFGATTITVAANIASVDDIERAVAEQSDGVGLFRTEFLFLDTPNPPTEDEQYESYRAAVSAWDQTVVLRTFDIGGDKPAEYLQLPEEENPFLGLRGVRLYERFPDLIDGQIRAALRASAHGRLALMIPMVSTLEEFTAVRDRVRRCRTELDSANVPCGDVELGVMVEVPSVAMTAMAFAQQVDFFSIGTNDLTQYTMAADRMMSELSHLHDPLHPAVLRMCAAVADAGAAHGRNVSVCGLAAADPLAAVIFAALGITKLSVSANAVNLVKATLNAQSVDIAEHIRRTLDTATSAAEVRSILEPLLVSP